jgi:N-acetylmuramoyl-L-alanine amidase
MDLSGQDLDNVTRTILSEVGQKGTPAEMASIATTIRNRLATGRFGGTPTEVVHQPYQFTPWNKGNEGAPNDPRSYQADSPAYKQAQALAQGVFSGSVQDQTGGATHYLAPAAMKQARPSWAPVGQQLTTIGPHEFYAPDGRVTPEQLAALGTAAAGQGLPGTAPRFAGNTALTNGQPGPYTGPLQNGPPGAGPLPNGQQTGATGVPGQSSLQDLLAALPHQQNPGSGPMTLGQMLLFGRQGLGGMLPENIQKNGLLGSMFKGLGGAASAGTGLQPEQPFLPLPANSNQANLQPPPVLPPPQPAQLPQQGQQGPALAPPFQPRFPAPPGANTAGGGPSGGPVPGQIMQGNGPVIPGQGDPHKPGFDPKAGQFINTPIGGQQQGLNDSGGGLSFLASLFGGGSLAA